LLPTNLPLFSRLLQLPIPGGMDLGLSPSEAILLRTPHRVLGGFHLEVLSVSPRPVGASGLSQSNHY
ncbi:MAG: hypothetical protein WA383_20035, partial [Terriglobales bacterium]